MLSKMLTAEGLNISAIGMIPTIPTAKSTIRELDHSEETVVKFSEEMLAEIREPLSKDGYRVRGMANGRPSPLAEDVI